jgi:4-amino-4-deoxy-L-arabinose transferase-like glycosyltransferase
MIELIVCALVGVVCIVLGISNMRGNLSSLHAYHRSRVTEADRLPFGRLVGLGTVFCGAGILLFGALSAITLYTESQVWLWMGTGLLVLGLAVGLGLSFYGMIKYNKGIF